MTRCSCSAAPCETPRLVVNPSYSTEVRVERFALSDLAIVDRGLDPSELVAVFSLLTAALALSYLLVKRHARLAAWCVLDLNGFHAFMGSENSARRRRWDLRLRLSQKEKRFFALLISFLSRPVRRVRPDAARA
jgi:hypothetical protein